MKSFMDWMTNVFAPKMNRIARNPWVASVQEAILATMPVILIGSFATIFNILRDFIPQIPDISMLNSFSFGLLSMFLAYLIPTTIMEKKRHRKTAVSYTHLDVYKRQSSSFSRLGRKWTRRGVSA